MNRKILLVPVAVATVAVMAATAFAQSNSYTIDMNTFPFMGRGIAVSNADSTVFDSVRIGVFKNSQSVPANVGAIVFGGERLDLANIALSPDGKVLSADIQRDGMTVGSFSASTTNQVNHLTGTLNLDGSTYNMYFFENPWAGVGQWGQMGGEMMSSEYTGEPSY